MPLAMRIHRYGGPEELVADTVAATPPRAGEIRIRHTAIGVNYTDIHARRGDYVESRVLTGPATIGMEGIGVVEAVGAGVTRFAVGARVGYAARPLGAYCEARNFPADACVAIPDGVPDDVAAASLLKGMTVEYLIRRVHRVAPGEVVVFHAAAGGVGTIAGQWFRALGAQAVGIVGSAEKAELARQNGYAHVFVQGRDDWPARVRELTGGAGVAAVYDSVGRTTWDGSLACLAPRGWMVCFGNSSGEVPPVSLNRLREKSLVLTWTRLGEFTATPAELDACATTFFAMVTAGAIRPRVQQAFPLARAADAHRLLEARGTTGSLVLVP
ncbi:MAG: quinone oxidoreductase [Burkholderiales bacterium]|nr:quinone oxidoreductase [Burkholderiales bacterium]